MLNQLRGILFVALCIMSLSCRENRAPAERNEFATSLRVFKLILQEITGEPDRISVLISDTQSPHAFHPRPSDISRLSGSSVLFLGDPHLDGWAEELGDLRVFYLSDLIPDTEILVDGSTPNPHFWTDPVVVLSMADGLTDELCLRVPDSCPTYRTNALFFKSSLQTLDVEMQTLLEPLRGACVFSAQPFFNYFLSRYGIEMAGILETVPGNEPSAAHLTGLLKKANDMNCIGLIAQRRLPGTASRVFAEESGLPIAFLDPVGTTRDLSYAEMLLRNANLVDSLASIKR